MKNLGLFLLLMIIAFSSFSQEDFKKATDCFNLAKQYSSVNNFEKAIENYKIASSIFKKLNENKNYVISELSLSELYISLGKVIEAKVLLDSILPISIKHHTYNSKITAHILSLQGRADFMTSSYLNAKIYFIKSYNIKFILFGENSVDIAMSCNDLALVYSSTGQLDSAIFYYQKNISILKGLTGENSALLAPAYINLSNLYITLGKYKEAISLKNKVVEIIISQKGENQPEIAEAYSGLGNSYFNIGELSFAENYFIRSNTILKALYGENNFKVANNYINLGNLYSNMGKFDYSLQYYFLATKILEGNPAFSSELPSLYNNIGLVCRRQGNNENAEIFMNKAIEIKLKNGEENSHQVAIIYQNLASIYLAKGDTTPSLTYYFRAIEIMNNLYGENNMNTIIPYLNIANIYYEKRNINESQKYFLKSVSANQKSKNNNNSLISTDLNEYFDGLNLLEALNGASKSLILLYTIDSSIVNIENSLFYLKLCDTLISDLRKKQLSDEDKIRLNSEISNIFDNAVEISYLLYDKYKKQEYLNEIFYFIERNKASTLLQSIAEAKAEKFSDIPDSLIILEQKIKQNINIYNQKITEATTLEEEYFYRDKLVGENKKMQKLIDTYKTNYTSFYNAKFNVTTTNIFQLQNLIDNNTAIINYYLTDEKLFTFIITKNEQLVLTTEYDNEFKKSIQKFNTVIQSNSNEDVKKYEKLGFSIYSKLFNFELPTAITKLIIVPNDILNTLSFEALLTEEYKGETKKFKEYPFFIKKYDVSYIYSATLLYETSKINYDNVTRTDIFLAAPVFKPDNPQEFSMHPISTIVGTETEVQNIGNIFNSKNLTNDILTNNLANENKLKNLFSTKQYKILHIATHGAVNIEQPELSALILSRDVNNIDDGILYTGEIYNIKIKSELVILSACETAIGKISEGEGVIGLSRAIMFAGSKNLIISLWKVADIATTELMTTFYKILLTEYTEINSNTTFSRSLHQAKLEMIEGKYNHPYFWSSFVLIGK